MEKTISGEEKCLENKNLRRSDMAANLDKLQDRNDRPWRCQGERLAG